jgi:hypothetical protein
MFIFRNSMGSKIVEGMIKPEVSKLERFVKNFKHVVSLIYLQKGKEGKIELGRCKIPVKILFNFLVPEGR